MHKSIPFEILSNVYKYIVDACAVCSTYFLIFLETDRANLDARLTFHEIREMWKFYLFSRKLLFKNLKLCWWLFQMVFRPFYVTRIAWHVVHFWCPRRAHYFVLEFRWQFCIELLNNNSHGLSSPGGLVSPSGGFVSLLCDQGLNFASILLCQASCSD